MILVWPLLLVAAALVAWKHRTTMRGRGWRWSLVWIVAGFLWSFSLATGFSVGLVLLPLAAAILLWAARCSPHLVEALGFIGGIAVTVAFLTSL